MSKTGKQIQGDFYHLLKDGALSSLVSGDVYREGYRPRDSRLEDAVVIFTAGLPDQIQTGVVTVNLFVPDIDPYGNGVLVEDGERCEILERKASLWVDSLTLAKTNYNIDLMETIHTERDEDIHQSFIVIKLKYKYF